MFRKGVGFLFPSFSHFFHPGMRERREERRREDRKISVSHTLNFNLFFFHEFFFWPRREVVYVFICIYMDITFYNRIEKGDPPHHRSYIIHS